MASILEFPPAEFDWPEVSYNRSDRDLDVWLRSGDSTRGVEVLGSAFGVGPECVWYREWHEFRSVGLGMIVPYYGGVTAM